MVQEESFRDKFKNYKIFAALYNIKSYHLEEQDFFLKLFKEYNSKLKDKDGVFKEYNSRVCSINIKIIENPTEITARREKFKEDMVTLYKLNYPCENETDRDLMKFKAILSQLTKSKLLIFKEYNIEEEIEKKTNPLDEKCHLLDIPGAYESCVSFFEYLIHLCKNEEMSEEVKREAAKELLEILYQIANHKYVDQSDRIGESMFSQENYEFSDFSYVRDIFRELNGLEPLLDLIKSHYKLTTRDSLILKGSTLKVQKIYV